jgi:hypothetical protein
MFVRPQILSTPHFVAVSGDSALEACTTGFTGCSYSFSCGPHGGSGGCVDTTYISPGAVIVAAGVVVVGGIAIAK